MRAGGGAHQSQTATSPLDFVPRRAGASAPPLTKPLTRIPPSQFDAFPPRLFASQGSCDSRALPCHGWQLSLGGATYNGQLLPPLVPLP